jgi:hypothetical protein
MGLTELKLLRTYADASSLEKPQRESTGTDAHGYRRARQQPTSDYTYRLPRQKSKFRQAAPYFRRGCCIRGGHGSNVRGGAGRQIGQWDVIDGSTRHDAILYENRSHYYYYYQVRFSFLIVLSSQELRMRMKCLRFLKK